MKNLISVNTNILYTKEGEDYKKHFEIVLLLDQAKYSRTNTGEIVRERGLEEQRFTVSENGLGTLIATLNKIKEVKEEELS